MEKEFPSSYDQIVESLKKQNCPAISEEDGRLPHVMEMGAKKMLKEGNSPSEVLKRICAPECSYNDGIRCNRYPESTYPGYQKGEVSEEEEL